MTSLRVLWMLSAFFVLIHALPRRDLELITPKYNSLKINSKKDAPTLTEDFKSMKNIHVGKYYTVSEKKAKNLTVQNKETNNIEINTHEESIATTENEKIADTKNIVNEMLFMPKVIIAEFPKHFSAFPEMKKQPEDSQKGNVHGLETAHSIHNYPPQVAGPMIYPSAMYVRDLPFFT